VPCSNGATDAHRRIINAGDDGDIFLLNDGLDGNLRGGLVERATHTDESLGRDEAHLIGWAIAILVYKVDLKPLAEHDDWDADEDENLGSLCVPHQQADED